MVPLANGLPNRLAFFWFPAVLVVAFIVLVASGISGSSTGIHWNTFGEGVDPALIAGKPRQIRSDEWLVQSSWIVSQSQQGFPTLNETLPGGMDATVQNDLPSWDWSSIFRPHVLGFLVLPLDNGMAVRWWLPALLLAAGCYWFIVTVLPRRPLTAALLTGGLFFTPILQWWFLPTTLLPVAWAFIGMTAVIWLFRDDRRWVRVGWAALTGYVAVAMVLSIYAPFIIPAALVFIAFFIGCVLNELLNHRTGWRQVLRRLIPLIAAGVAAGAVVGLWLLTRKDTIAALFSTVYPGQRFESTGLAGLNATISLFGAPFDGALQNGVVGALGPNESESSTALMFVVFLFVPLAWLLYRDWTTKRRVDWTIAGTVAVTVLIFAFLYVPGWDRIAHLILIDRSPGSRMRLAFAILAIVAVVVLIRRLDERDVTMPWSVVWVSLGATAGSILVPWFILSKNDPATLSASPWRIVALLVLASVFLLLKRLPFLAAVAFLAASLLIGGSVNPLYSGVFDLNSTKVGEEIGDLNDADPGVWVGVGGYESTALLVESGVEALNGVQTYPPKEMWSMIDPAGRYPDVWNRLANVSWDVGQGEPVVTSPIRDQIRVSFDSCSAFAQREVTHVLSDTAIDQPCLKTVAVETQGASRFWIYDVVPAS
ncbi:DUF7657 domain-containing protein [Herbiconiux liangxiaofengii]|uniref:DUF7657 domain-containing protein n=1 Tax=Herbiconiux liangxiaofengii TaxID=3342795 RepID=UPI0035B9018B